mmetsp:Transcript_6058/g.5212  ORF Transcript_6058/g.5212 Transcript_6058/m.5212 type:complete len:101 (-) Transcript_6058:56-358(-)
MVSKNKEINPNGCGIGLTICKKLVEKLNGTISLESSFGIGSRITLRIPYEKQPNRALAPASMNKCQSENKLITSRLGSVYQKANEFEDKASFVNKLQQTT